MNLKKSQFAYVLAVTNCSTGNKDPKLFSVDRYESKETPKHNCWMMKAYIFFSTHKVTEDFHKNSLFLLIRSNFTTKLQGRSMNIGKSMSEHVWAYKRLL